MSEAYKAGGNGRLLKLFRATNHGPNAANGSLGTLQGRSRERARNDPWAQSALDKSVANGVGCGIQRKQLWGTDQQKARVKELFESWMPYADADGVLDWYGLQALAWREEREAGEVFVRIRQRRASDGLPVPLQIQLIESEQCPASYYSTAPRTGNQIKAGVEFNRIGRRVAYWMHPRHPGDQVWSGESNELVRIPAEQILHIYRPTRAGQIRGVPCSASVLVEMFNRATLDDTVMERQKMANLFGGFYVNKGTSSAPFVEEMQTATDTDGTPIAGLEPGMMQELPQGYEVDFATPPAPGNDYNEFMRQRLMAIAAAFGLPYEVLTGDLRNISDRALKLILNEFRRAIECHQWLCMIPQMCQPVAQAFMDAAVLSGALEIPGYADVRLAASKSLWVPQGWPYSHPVQDVNADIAAIRAGLGSRTGVVLSNGEDPEQIDSENAADNARADAAGLSYDSDGRRPKTEPFQDKEDPKQ